MEVHIKNVPEQTNEKALKNFLKPHLSQLRIRNVHIYNHYGKNWATITFLNSTDAQTFLTHYGQTRPHPNRRPIPISSLYVQLTFFGKPIYCEKSNKPANPVTLRVLKREESERQIARIGDQSKPPEILPVTFNTTFLSCGTWDYHDSELVFVPQVNFNVKGTAKFSKKSMMLVLESGFRLDFRYSAILSITAETEPAPTFVFSMLESPRLFQKIEDDTVTTLLALLRLSGNGPKPRKSGPQRHRLPGLNDEHEQLAGNCLVYRVVLENYVNISRGAQDAIEDRIHDLRKAKEVPFMTHRRIDVCHPDITYDAAFRMLREALSSLNCSLPFEVAFQVQKLAQNNYLHPSKVLELLPAITRLVDRTGVLVTVASIRKLFKQIPFPAPDIEASKFDLDALTELLNNNADQLKKDGVPTEMLLRTNTRNVAIIHKVTVTPTGIYLLGPEQESNNRILRKYSAHHDSFIRVRFCDEDGSQLYFGQKISSHRIFHSRFKKILEEGIQIAGRTYSFLGFSHSSLRAQSCWFAAPFIHDEHGLQNYEDIIQDLGNFSLLRSPAKCAARIGQAFSDTRTAVSIDPKIVSEVEDIERNGRVFSDGVGTISLSLMEKIADKLPLLQRCMPACLQIRYRGAKGMVSLDTRLEGDALILRPSMIKYGGSTSNDIEICDATYKPLPVYLNRQFIKILEDLGVEDSWFMNLQSNQVEKLRSITESPINASSFLRRQSIGEPFHLPWLITKLAMMDIDFKMDGFLRDILEVALLVELRELKHRTRIPVPEGWHLHGVLDETGVLEEGQVVVVGNVDGVRKFITGKRIMISRAPALHPGDIQLVDAIMPPPGSPLLNLANCVCFSQKGARDLPSQLGGGDLDGDRYYIIWDEELHIRTTDPPADYPKVTPVDIGRVVKRTDMIEFFIQFMETDLLGRVAIGHMVLADQREYGVRDGDCITLAEMHSTAVDFSKTGIPVDGSKTPKYGQWRPDFMAPGPHVDITRLKGISFIDFPEGDNYLDQDDQDDDFPSYRYYGSDRVIGKLFRAIDERQIFENIQNRALNEGITSGSTVIGAVWDYVQSTCELIQWKHLQAWARDVRDMYEDCISNIMTEYSGHPNRPISELEAFVGNFLGKTGAANKQQRDLSTNMKERFEEDSRSIVNFILKDGNEWSKESLERSMACLAVSLEERPAHRGKEHLLSFKYVAAGVCLREVERLPLVPGIGLLEY